MKKFTLSLLFIFAIGFISFAQYNYSSWNNNPFEQYTSQDEIIPLEEFQQLNQFVGVNKSFKSNSKDSIWGENFDTTAVWTLPPGWSILKDQVLDYLYVAGGQVNFYHQIFEYTNMVLITPKLNLSDFTKLTFDLKGAVANGDMYVGIMSDSSDISTFELINIYSSESDSWKTNEAILSTYSGEYHIAFNFYATRIGWAQLLYFDNVILYNNNVVANMPLAVSNLSITPDEGGVNGATLAWTNPTKEADGDLLLSIDSILVFSNGVQVSNTTHDMSLGGNVELELNVENAGYYKYTVKPYNYGGEGYVNATEQVWIGLDEAAAVTNLTASITGEDVTLTWSAPTEGAHGAYYDTVVTEYIVTRADGIEYTVNGEDTSFTETLDVFGTYNYTVTPVNNSGQGVSASSNTIAHYGNYFLYEDFWVSVPALDWSIESDGYAPWRLRTYTNVAGGEKPEARLGTFGYSTYFDSVAKMVSPIISTSGYEMLLLEFKHYQDWQDSVYRFAIETSSDSGYTWNEAWSIEVNADMDASLERIILNTDDIGSDNFQFAITYLGSGSSLKALYIDDIRLMEPPAIDLAIQDFKIPITIQPNDTVTPTVLAKNISALGDSCSITCVFNNGTDDTYTSVVKTYLASGSNETIVFDSWVAPPGEYTVSVEIESYSTDENPDNNVLHDEFNVYEVYDRNIVIAEEGTGTWCVYCPGASMGLDELIENDYPVGVIAYHSGDTYQFDDGLYRLDFYGITGFPTVYFDGSGREVVGGSPSISMYNTYVPIVDELIQKGTPINLELGDLTVDENNQMVAEVSLESKSPIANEHLVLYAVITETDIDQIWGHDDIMETVDNNAREIFNGKQGVSVDLSDMSDKIDISFGLNPLWNSNNLEVIVFVQDTITKEIFNGAKSSEFTKPGLNVEFNVDMTKAEGFDAATDIIYITGSFTDWADPGSDETLAMTDEDGDLVYSITIELEEGNYEYKYFKNAGWTGGEWEGGDNRAIAVVDDMEVTDIWGDIKNDIELITLTNNGVTVYPNPFKDELNIKLNMLQDANTSIQIYSILGELVDNKALGTLYSGSHTIKFNGSNLKNGFYFVVIKAGNQHIFKKVNLIR